MGRGVEANTHLKSVFSGVGGGMSLGEVIIGWCCAVRAHLSAVFNAQSRAVIFLVLTACTIKNKKGRIILLRCYNTGNTP